MMNFLRKYIYLPIVWVLWGRSVPYKIFDAYERELTKITEAMMETGEALVRINGVLCRMYKIDPNGGLGYKNVMIERVEDDERSTTH